MINSAAGGGVHGCDVIKPVRRDDLGAQARQKWQSYQKQAVKLREPPGAWLNTLIGAALAGNLILFLTMSRVEPRDEANDDEEAQRRGENRLQSA